MQGAVNAVQSGLGFLQSGLLTGLHTITMGIAAPASLAAAEQPLSGAASSDARAIRMVLLLRHGQAEHNPRYYNPLWILHTMLGRDTPLTPRGIEQAHEARSCVEGFGWLPILENIYVSPLQRTIHTASIACVASQELRQPPLELCPLLAERNLFICDTGSPVDVILSRTPYVAKGPWCGVDQLTGEWWPPAMEGDDQLMRRVSLLKKSLVDRPERIVGCVGHGAFFRALCGVKLPNAVPRWAALRTDGSVVLKPEWDALDASSLLEISKQLADVDERVQSQSQSAAPWNPIL